MGKKVYACHVDCAQGLGEPQKNPPTTQTPQLESGMAPQAEIMDSMKRDIGGSIKETNTEDDKGYQ